jgi:2-oxoisovalerate dehydrogenase E1 component
MMLAPVATGSLDKTALLRLYETMLLIREAESRMVALYQRGEFKGHVLPALGQEAIPAALSLVLRPTDYVVTGHRGGGHYIAHGGNLDGMFAEYYHKATGVMKGRGGQMHLLDREANVIAGNAIVGAQWVLGTGAALAARMEGGDRVAVIVGGEGSTNRGTFHEGINFAAVKKLPALYVVEFNGYQMWNPAAEILPVADLSERAKAYGIPGVTVDGNDPIAVLEAAEALIARARRGEGPALLECKTFKWTDSGTNRRLPKELAEEWMTQRDPVAMFRQRLVEQGALGEAEDVAVRARVTARVDRAVEFARASPDVSPTDGLDEVYATRGTHPASLPAVIAGGDAGRGDPGRGNPAPTDGKPTRYVDAIRDALAEELSRDPRVFVYGEAIGGEQQGIFKATAGLQEEFGPLRVMETPLSEAAIAGSAIGAAIFGMRPVAEIMFNNLLALVGDELHNQAGKFHYLSGGSITVPAVIRTASWMRVTSGPHHCGLLDAWLMNTPGIKVVSPATPADAKGLLKAAIRDANPVVFLEHSALYKTEGLVPEGDYIVPIGVANVVRKGRDVSIITYGFLVGESLAAAQMLEEAGLPDGPIDAEVVDLRTLKPLDKATVLASVRKTGRAVVAYEGTKYAGAGAEVAALIAEESIDWLEGPVVRVAMPDVPYPSNPTLLTEIMIDRHHIIAGVRRAMGII